MWKKNNNNNNNDNDNDNNDNVDYALRRAPTQALQNLELNSSGKHWEQSLQTSMDTEPAS